jgi:hypothetical protein
MKVLYYCLILFILVGKPAMCSNFKDKSNDFFEVILTEFKDKGSLDALFAKKPAKGSMEFIYDELFTDLKGVEYSKKGKINIIQFKSSLYLVTISYKEKEIINIVKKKL